MRHRSIRYMIPALLMLLASGCRSLNQTPPVAAGPPRQTHGQMVAGIHAVTEGLEAEILMRFVHTPDQDFFNNVMGIVGRIFTQLPTLAPNVAMCPGGTTHVCSTCEGYSVVPCPPVVPWPPPKDQVGLPQTPVQMIAGIQSAMRLLNAEILTRFVHTPNQQFFNEVMKILGRAFEELPRFSAEELRSRCPQGTVPFKNGCMSKELFEALGTRRF